MKRILIVEDDPPLRKALKSCLTKEGYVSDVSCSVENAREMLLAKPYDLMITDYHLDRKKTGLDLLAFMNKASLQTPSIVMSGTEKEELSSRALRLGAYAFLSKPFQVSCLIALCKQALNSSPAH